MDKETEKFEKDMDEVRQGHDQFHWYITGFATAVLAFLFNFIKDASPIRSIATISYLKISIWFLIGIIILSPLRNYLSYLITSLFAQSRREWKPNLKEGVRLHNRAAFLTKVRWGATYLSMGLCITVLILLAIAINKLYL